MPPVVTTMAALVLVQDHGEVGKGRDLVRPGQEEQTGSDSLQVVVVVPYGLPLLFRHFLCCFC